jgi:hypothetical protein
MAAAEAKMSAWLGVDAAFGVVDFLGLGGFFKLTAFFGLSALVLGNLCITSNTRDSSSNTEPRQRMVPYKKTSHEAMHFIGFICAVY